MSRKSTPWIQTHTGQAFDLVDPDPETINIEDIAHALASICRYTGHTDQHYSVAQHSVIASELVAPGFEFWALMHDAHEAYIGDMAKPLKGLCPDYKVVEDRIAKVVRERFGLVGDQPSEVGLVDVRLLVTEAPRFLGPPPKDWGIGVEPYDIMMWPWNFDEAHESFLHRFRELGGEWSE